ncbi:MAG: peptidase [Ruminococcus sp.]|nr:peptidase [Ruminococcus sp.]MBQ8905333.1 site-2 protease family protein [Ruminococcus sp.]
MVDILIAILVFGVIIAVHEFGHFAVAKACGIRVNQFAIGMGPAIFKFQRGETEYALRLLPIGGYCAMEGEDSESTDDRAFRKKSVPKRIAVVVAGAAMNLLLGFVLVLITTCLSDLVPSTTISRFHKDDAGNSVATSEQCGLQVDDKILSINGMRVFTDGDISYKLSYTEDPTFDLVVERNGEKVTLNDVTFLNTKTEGRLDFGIYGYEKTPLNVLSYSFRETISIGRMIWMSLFDLITGKYGFHDLSGPVGIVTAIGDAASTGTTIKQHLQSLIPMMSMITINVGIFNLLPLPALDGGRLIFLIVEAIRRKPVKPEHEGLVHIIGLVLLFVLMIAVTFNDIKNLIA